MMIIPAIALSASITGDISHQARRSDDVTPVVWHTNSEPMIRELQETPAYLNDMANGDSAMQSAVDRLSEDRMTLFVRKMAGANSAELAARLEIINAQLEAMAPRVTEAAVSSLETFARELAEIRSGLHEIEDAING